MTYSIVALACFLGGAAIGFALAVLCILALDGKFKRNDKSQEPAK
jgi:hypothetical protein